MAMIKCWWVTKPWPQSFLFFAICSALLHTAVPVDGAQTCSREPAEIGASCDPSRLLSDLQLWISERKAAISAEECNYQKLVPRCVAHKASAGRSLSQDDDDMELALSPCADSTTQHQSRGTRGDRHDRAQEKAVKADVRPDAQIEELRRQNKILSALLVTFVTLCVALAAALAVGLIYTVKNDDSRQTSSNLATMNIGSSHQVLSGEDARHMLSMFAENQIPVSSILTSPDVYSAEDGHVFMLVPVNLSGNRSLALFGNGGNFESQLRVARDLVTNQLKNKRLVLVLYEYKGRAFAEAKLGSSGTSADKLAFEAVPKDQPDFPTDDDILVLWTSKAHGLRVSDSGGESELSGIVTQQPWAVYLGERA